MNKKTIFFTSTVNIFLLFSASSAFAENNSFNLNSNNFFERIYFQNTNNINLKSKEDINKVFEIGVQAYEKQNFWEAIEIFKKITQKFPGYGDAHYYIGLSYFALGKYYLSIAHFLEANRIFGKEKLDALFGAGLAYLSSGYTDEAKSAFRKVAKESDDPDLINDAKTWIDSIEEQILQKEKVDLLSTDINFREGIEYLEEQSYNKAEMAFKNSLNNNPSSLLSLYYLGNTQYLLEKYDESIENFEKVILISPDSKIANDARLYIKVIEDVLVTSFPDSKQYFFQGTIGSLYDSNLSYADTNNTIIRDMAGILNLTAGYIFNKNVQTQYSYYGSVFTGVNDNIPELNIHSYDFNLQRHSALGKFNYPFYNNLLGELDYNINWYILAGNSFLVNNRISPRFNYYINSNLVTVFQYNLDLNNYPIYATRNSVDHSLGLFQYIYMNNNNLWFKLGYEIEKVNANDKILEQSGFLPDGSQYDLRYRFTNSFLSNSLSADMGINLFYNSKLRLTTKLSLNSFDYPDIYFLTSPTTNIATGEKEVNTIKNTSKTRFDVLIDIGLTYSIPIYQNISGSITYNLLNNSSNITNNDYTGRSYFKHLVGINLTYDF